MTATRTDWGHVLARAVEVVRSYDTGVTLRQLFYRLVSEQEIPNTQSAYKRLSDLSAKARREGAFPDLIDLGRDIHRPAYWDSPVDALDAIHDQYRLDRTTGQDVSIYLGVEKRGIVVQLQKWFGKRGIPVLALGGYSSQTYVDEIVVDVESADRPAVLLYAGDFDPSGEDIDRDFIERTGCWDRVVRIALNAEQVREYGLPVNPGKTTDSRAGAFIARHGELEVELDALPPETLHTLYEEAVAEYWDTRPRTNACSPRSELTETGSGRRVTSSKRTGVTTSDPTAHYARTRAGADAMKGAVRLCSLYRTKLPDGSRVLAATMPAGGVIVIERNTSPSASHPGAADVKDIKPEGGTGLAFGEDYRR